LALKASDGGPELTLFGTDYPTPDGTCIRDYIHVNDLADAHILAFEKMQNEPAVELRVYNLGTGSGVSNLEILSTIQSVTGRKVKYRQGPRRVGDPPALVAAGDKAKKELNWIPRVSDIKTIISNAEGWHQKTHRR
jgi:UDP-glucose 4-epimerase